MALTKVEYGETVSAFALLPGTGALAQAVKHG